MYIICKIALYLKYTHFKLIIYFCVHNINIIVSEHLDLKAYYWIYFSNRLGLEYNLIKFNKAMCTIY